VGEFSAEVEEETETGDFCDVKEEIGSDFCCEETFWWREGAVWDGWFHKIITLSVEFFFEFEFMFYGNEPVEVSHNLNIVTKISSKFILNYVLENYESFFALIYIKFKAAVSLISSRAAVYCRPMYPEIF
jgi:hypothetical protein